MSASTDRLQLGCCSFRDWS